MYHYTVTVILNYKIKVRASVGMRSEGNFNCCNALMQCNVNLRALVASFLVLASAAKCNGWKTEQQHT